MSTFLTLILHIILGIMSLIFLSCSDESPNGTQPVGSLNVSIQHLFGNANFSYGETYVLSTGEQVKGTLLRYFISNIALVRADGSTYIIPQKDSYFLVDESIPTSKLLKLQSIPSGTYTSIRFMIGIDSLRSTMGLDERTGILDVGAAAQDMYWSWNSGYIHFKFEGNYIAQTSIGDIRYHIGGFGGYSSPTINTIRSVSLEMGNPALDIQAQSTKTITLAADISKIFNGVQQFSVAENPSVMFSPFAITVANNYAVMFSVAQKD